MNIENIAALAAQLQLLGFDKLSSPLLKKISFKPVNFFLTHKIQKGSDQFGFLLFFEKQSRENNYYLKYYDTMLQKETGIAYTELNDVNLIELESKMSELDWKAAFDITIKKPWTAADKTSWDKEQKVEEVVNELQQLEVNEEGKTIATNLKLKYWDGMPFQEMAGPITPIKNKSDVSQRFYFSEDHPGISVDEAMRFLQNRWLDKQMQSRKKLPETAQTTEEEGDSMGSQGSGLLRKKRFAAAKGSRKNHVLQS